MEILDGNSFSNYRMGKILFTQNSFENTCINVECQDVGVWSGEMENDDVCVVCAVMLACLAKWLFACIVYRLDENVAGVYEEGDYFDQQEPEHFVEQGKLLRWACIYISLF